ncbi:MAG: hypothetical protein DCF12_05375 [Snowella sp.]|nr:MAG: hypothetical protein DCF12_05375 [Snowella sp.]
MPIESKVYRIFIASPSDIRDEREIVRKQIARWNSLHAISYQMFLHPVDGEDSAPSLDERGQAIINKLVDDCDFLIGIFWTRLGTRTPEAESGTAEEIDRARSKGKRCMVYFCEKSQSQIDQIEYERLQKYKEELQPNGLINNYETLEDFNDKVFGHITSTVLEIFNENNQRLAIENRAKETEDAIGLNITGSGGDVNIKNLLINPSSSSTNLSFNTLLEAKFSVRALLESRFGIQDMEDIKDQEIAKIQSTLSSPQMAELFNQRTTVETISTITTIMEKATTSSIYALAMIGRYADDGSPDWLDIVGDWIERLSTETPMTDLRMRWASPLKRYPALLLLYSLGISSVRAGKINFLKEVFSRKAFSSEYDFFLSQLLNPISIFSHNIGKIIEPGFERLYTPVSEHLASVAKNLLYLSEEEDYYLQWFDFFELLFSLKMTQQISKTYFGSFSWRLENDSRTQRFIFKRIQDIAISHGKDGERLLDFFDGEIEFNKTATQFDQNAAKHFRDHLWGSHPYYISQLIKLSQEGTRVSNYSDLQKSCK